MESILTISQDGQVGVYVFMSRRKRSYMLIVGTAWNLSMYAMCVVTSQAWYTHLQGQVLEHGLLDGRAGRGMLRLSPFALGIILTCINQ
jgi:hypothetical protein